MGKEYTQIFRSCLEEKVVWFPTEILLFTSVFGRVAELSLTSVPNKPSLKISSKVRLYNLRKKASVAAKTEMLNFRLTNHSSSI